MIPVRNTGEFTIEGNRITLLIPKFKSAWLRKWLIPSRRSQYFRIHLDEKGSRVWELINGERNTLEICNLVRKDLHIEEDKSDQFDLLVTEFLRQLFKSRFILFR